MACKRSSMSSQRGLQRLEQQIDDLTEQMEEFGILPKGSRRAGSHDYINKLERMKQGSKDVVEYTIEFRRLLWKYALEEDDQRVVVGYFLGLNDYIRRVVVNQPFTNL